MATSLNKRNITPAFTHNGAKTVNNSSLEQLTRSVSTCLLWEKTFYEDGEDVYKRIASLVPKVSCQDVYDLAVKARNELGLRHVPLVLARELARDPARRPVLKTLLPRIVKRADELAEFLSLYWKDGKIPVANAIKEGLGAAFNHFDEYQLAKYNQNKDIRLKDVLRIVHPTPESPEKSELFRKLKDDCLAVPYTWETELSAKGNNVNTWTELLSSGRMPAQALIQNLRNIVSAGVSHTLVTQVMSAARTDKILPYKFIAAAKHAPQYEKELEQMMLKNLSSMEKMSGHTLLLVDRSGSMGEPLSTHRGKKNNGGASEMVRMDAASGLSIMLRELCEDVSIYTFYNRQIDAIPARHGMALRDALGHPEGGTMVGESVRKAVSLHPKADRIIVLTDEQSSDRVPPVSMKAYICNVSVEQHGVGYDSGWKHVHGWSEHIVRYIQNEEHYSNQ